MNEGKYIALSLLRQTCLINKNLQLHYTLSGFRYGKGLGTCKHLGNTLNKERCLNFEYSHGKFNSILLLFLTLNLVNGILM